MDAERAAGHVRGPLHGIPVMVKDNLDAAGLPDHGGLASRWRTASPTRTRRSSPSCAPRARSCSARLNLSEFANFLTNGMPSGYSLARRAGAEPLQRGHHAERLVAAAPARPPPPAWRRSRSARRPPARSSAPPPRRAIVGLRPTVGLVSRTGILPISATQDTAGPMTRTVADAAAELGAIAGKDPEDPATDSAPATVPDYLAGLKPDALAGKRIGVITNTNAQYRRRSRRSRRSARRR